jgi:hypothetical protein
MGVGPVASIRAVLPLKSQEEEGFEPPAIEADRSGRAGDDSYDGGGDTPEDGSGEGPAEVKLDSKPGRELGADSASGELQSHIDVVV